MKKGKVANLVDWNTEDEYDELIEKEILRKQEVNLHKSFKRYADSIIADSRKLQSTRKSTGRI